MIRIRRTVLFQERKKFKGVFAYMVAPVFYANKDNVDDYKTIKVDEHILACEVSNCLKDGTKFLEDFCEKTGLGLLLSRHHLIIGHKFVEDSDIKKVNFDDVKFDDIVLIEPTTYNGRLKILFDRYCIPVANA